MCHCAWTDFEELSPIHGPYHIRLSYSFNVREVSGISRVGPPVIFLVKERYTELSSRVYWYMDTEISYDNEREIYRA